MPVYRQGDLPLLGSPICLRHFSDLDSNLDLDLELGLVFTMTCEIMLTSIVIFI